MTNAEIIATTLDGFLDHEVKLIIYGRAALALGFDNVPEAVGRSLDLDVILPFSEVARIEADDQFWAALHQLNKSLESRGIVPYSHFARGSGLPPSRLGKTYQTRFAAQHSPVETF